MIEPATKDFPWGREYIYLRLPTERLPALYQFAEGWRVRNLGAKLYRNARTQDTVLFLYKPGSELHVQGEGRKLKDAGLDEILLKGPAVAGNTRP